MENIQMNKDTQLIIFVVCFLIGVNSSVGLIAYNSILASENDLKSFKELSCAGQNQLLTKYQLNNDRDITDKRDYFISECVLKDNSYNERLLRIQQQNDYLWQNSPYLILIFVILFGLQYGFNRYYQWSLREQEKDRTKNSSEMKKS